MNRAAIRERLKVVGAEALYGLVRRDARWSFHGEEEEDFLQEAILAHLENRDVKSALWKLRAQKRYEFSLEAMLESMAQRRGLEHPLDLIDRKFTDNERPDWIPEDLVDRYRVIASCQRAIRVSYRPKEMINGRVPGVLYVLNHQQYLGHFQSNAERGEAVREALERIIGWCTP